MSRIKKKLKQIVRNKANTVQESENALNSFNQTLAMLRTRAGEANELGNATTQDLYGETIDRQKRTIRDGANDTKAALARIANVKGGDVSGATGATIRRVEEGASRETGAFLSDIEGKADNRRMAERNREMQLMGLVSRGEAGLLSRADNNLRFERELEMQRRQNRRNFLSNMLGMGLTLGASFINPAAGVAVGAATMGDS